MMATPADLVQKQQSHFHRRSLLKMAGLSGFSWLTPLATRLARSAEADRRGKAKSLIVLWLEGAPSQLETFDPHEGTVIAGGSKARKTNVKRIKLGEGLEQVAEQMDHISLIRSVTSKEGDHERAIYNVKTGFRPDPTLIHPSIGSVICHQMNHERDRQVDIPRHISILPSKTPGRGGYLGDQYDAFKVFDPVQAIPDVASRVETERQLSRLEKLKFADRQFLKNRRNNLIVGDSLRNTNLDAAIKMMSSDQLNAFDVSQVSESERSQFGDTPFGRGCLAALRLIETGVRCVEVTLTGWDSHVNNHETQAGRINILDPAYASLIKELKKRDLLDSTMVVCGGEFGRTPWINPLGGRDHWPRGFSIALAGGGIQGGRVIGETDSNPARDAAAKGLLKEPHPIEDVHATVFSAMGIEFQNELDTPVGRPMKISEGKPVKALLDL
ncbi:MAG: DUF1501 domain-containing protein [Mariniblastus sp.]|nr:DUF1501 domain-containing protein [Mariniblastus sp.]